MTQLTKLINKYSRRLDRANEQLDQYKDISYTLTLDGKWSHGYLVGKISELENTLDELAELAETQFKTNKDT